MRFLRIFLLMLLTMGVAHAEDPQRIALVIGIGTYAQAPELPNARNDSRAFAGALRKLGFVVEERNDLPNRGLAEALRDFGVRAQKAEVALIYFAGHGMQVGGTNYLIPADAKLARERDLVYEALPLNLPLGEVSQARKLGILIIDACRNNPFVERLARSTPGRVEVHAGFARIDDTPSDTLVALATRADAVAEDGAGEHSPYTEALLKNLEVPGLELSLFFRRVRDSVMQTTQGRQEPYIYGSLGATPFYFNPQPENRPPELGALKPLELSDRAGAEPMRIARPTDPDGDQLFAQVTGLPRGGAARIGDRVVLIGDYLTVDQLAAVTFKPDASHVGDAGSFDFAVMDGRGGVARGRVAVTIKPSNRAPIAAAERTVHAAATALRMEPPVDPDGDPLTLTVSAVPERGTVKDGTRALKPGDRLSPEQLAGLTFEPERGAAGRAGAFAIQADDGRGGRTAQSVVLEVDPPGAPPADGDVEEALWRRVRDSRSAGEVEAFLRLFAEGPHAALARERLASLVAEGEGGVTSLAAATPPSSQPPPAQPKPAELKVETSADGMYVAVADASLRAGPDNRSDVVGSVGRGATVRVVGRVQDADWYRVSMEDGVQGFLSGPTLRPAGREDRQRLALAAPTNPQPRAETPNAFQDCAECPKMVHVPGGGFLMGSDKGDTSQRPAHRVTVKPFALGVYEVTVAEWRACVEAGGCSEMPRMANATDETPVHNIHWGDAQAYVAWLGKKTGQRYRLPSEAEWEYAARAGSTSRYGWGEVGGVGNANCRDCGGSFDRLRPASVGSFRPNAFGVHDMHGGVAEWVADCWNAGYKGAPSDGTAWTSGECKKRVLRGGSWRDELESITVTVRLGYDADVRYVADGFRVAREP
ncbi:SUMF1/EgtB/PvdO family nonheme iron enzyme [Azospirillum sp. TSO22-1]|uniref:SUMF1/EgtB/PvdO family nonheme iron enzyme n=1 Tax=Azospirillum sp. TSO22-1 TaxID=716789 RepID=UPI000D64AB44|nr:SUMF1/EgtB/PvdO family nonheme iron enzyme [Azospirillum sp. TSO22-1]